MIHDALRGGYGISMRADEVSVPGMSLHSSMGGAAAYYALVVWQPLLSPREGQALITAFLVCSSAAARSCSRGVPASYRSAALPQPKSHTLQGIGHNTHEWAVLNMATRASKATRVSYPSPATV